MKILRLSILVSCLFCGSVYTGDLPVLVQQLCRHGDRSPGTFFPANQNQAYWKQGKGYLTPQGQAQLYNNGKAFRSNWYPGLLNENPIPSEFMVHASHFDRVIMSAMAFLAGLYPPKGDYVFEAGLKWQAVAVHQITAQVDYYLFGYACPAKEQSIADMEATEEYRNFIAENQAFINETCREAGYNSTQWTIDDLYFTQDNLFCDSQHNLTLPTWATQEVIEEAERLLNINRQFLYSKPETVFLAHGGGPLVAWMVDNLKAKMNGSMSQKLIYYSAHDTTMQAFFATLGLVQKTNPPYASCGFLELFETANGYKVQVSLRSSENGMNQQKFLLPGCSDAMCDLETFINTFSKKLNSEPAYYCDLVDNTQMDQKRHTQLGDM